MGENEQCTLVVVCNSESELIMAVKAVSKDQRALFISTGAKPSLECVAGLEGRQHICMPNAMSWHSDIGALLKRMALLYTNTWSVILAYAEDIPSESEIKQILGSLMKGQKSSIRSTWSAVREDVAIDGFELPQTIMLTPEKAEIFEPEEISTYLADTVPMFHVSYGNLTNSLNQPAFRRIMESLKSQFISRNDKEPKTFFTDVLNHSGLQSLQNRLPTTSRIVMFGKSESSNAFLKEYSTIDSQVVRIYPGVATHQS